MHRVRSRVIIVIVQVGAAKICVCSICVAAAVEALRKKERQDETQFTTKIGGKTSSVPVISFCKISIPGYAFDIHSKCKQEAM
jgi:hypothetical protein